MSQNKYIRDENSGAVVSTDVEGLIQYKARRRQTMRVEELRQEVITLRDDMTEIKTLLQSIVKTNING